MRKRQNKKQTVVVRKKIGNVYRGRTKYIDPEPKLERNYVVISEKNNDVTVAKLKTIKKFGPNNENADEHLYELNQQKYGFKNRTGVDDQKFYKNRMSGKRLNLDDKRVFPESKERFRLSSNDTHDVLVHTKRVKQKKNADKNLR